VRAFKRGPFGKTEKYGGRIEWHQLRSNSIKFVRNINQVKNVNKVQTLLEDQHDLPNLIKIDYSKWLNA